MISIKTERYLFQTISQINMLQLMNRQFGRHFWKVFEGI